MRGGFRMSWRAQLPTRSDAVASLVVLVVAIPLSLGISLASGASPAAGLISAIVGGLVVGAFSGAPLVVSGPAAGLAALILQIVQQHGVQALAAIGLLAGLGQILLAAARAGEIFTRVPKAVLEGMLAAIGTVIAIGQLHVLMGGKIPSNALEGLATLPASFSFGPALACGALAIGIQLAWPRVWPKHWPTVPAALPAVLVVTLLALGWAVPRAEMVPLAETLGSQWAWWTAGEWRSTWTAYLAPAVGLMFVASAESLLCVRAVDGLVRKRDGSIVPAKLNRELLAQGVGNTLCGVLGAIPVTAVIVRSAANVQAGARTRWSTMLHGLGVAAFALLLPQAIAAIPLAALASVLVLIGFRLLDLRQLAHLWKDHPAQAGLWVLTYGAILATDLLTGLVVSLVVYAVGSGVASRLGRKASPQPVAAAAAAEADDVTQLSA